MIVALMYDGSYEGFLSACHKALRMGDDPVEIVSEGQNQLIMGRFEVVGTSVEEAKLMVGWVERHMGERAVKLSELAFRSEARKRESKLLSFFRVGLNEGKSWECPPWPPEVEVVVKMARFTLREYHRWRGITRFRRVSDGGFYLAEVEPDADILDFLARHFRKRMPDVAWEIHDVRRRRKVSHHAGPAPSKDLIERPSSPQDWVSAVWDRYFNAVSLPERRNLRLKKAHLPVRYWNFVPEYREMGRGDDCGRNTDDP